jgi:hypothetical protein
MIAPRPQAKALLDLRLIPRHNIYLDTDTVGSFLIDTEISYTRGIPYCSSLGDAFVDAAAGVRINFVLFRSDTGQTVLESVQVGVNQTGIEVQFGLIDFEPRMEPYEITIRAVANQCGRTYQMATHLYRLPERTDGGSVVRVDNKFGGISVSSSVPDHDTVWKPIFPYAFYVGWSNYLEGSVANLTKYADLGYNVIHPTPGNGNNPWTDIKSFEAFLDVVETLGMHLIYDMRWTFKNITSVTDQVKRLKNRKSILSWYTADEPDGQGDPLDSTSQAYNAIKAIDPYHPVSLVLNCENFHYKEYAAGADIILADPYPIGTDMTFSVQYHTTCNTTFGDCGCDNCLGNLLDVSNRMDALRNYQTWQGPEPKTFWGVPQAFGGSEYWSRAPTAAEEVAMAMLFVNHDAKGIVAWNFPTTQEIANATGQLAKALSKDTTTEFLLGAKVQPLTLNSQRNFDAAAWRIGKRVLFSIVNVKNEIYTKEMKLGLGVNAKTMQTLWPPKSDNWYLAEKSIVRSGMGPLEVNVFIVETE